MNKAFSLWEPYKEGKTIKTPYLTNFGVKFGLEKQAQGLKLRDSPHLRQTILQQ